MQLCIAFKEAEEHNRQNRVLVDCINLLYQTRCSELTDSKADEDATKAEDSIYSIQANLNDSAKYNIDGCGQENYLSSLLIVDGCCQSAGN